MARKHLKNPKAIEKAKTIAVVALVLSAVCLVLTVFNIQGRLNGKGELFWFVNAPQDVISGTSGDASNTITAFSVLSEPEFILVNGTEGRYILEEKNNIYSKAVETINIIIKDLHSTNAEYIKLEDYAEWNNALKVNSLYVRYPGNRQTDFEAQFYEIGNSALVNNISTYSEILLLAASADEGSIAMIPTEDGVFKIKTNISPVAINEIIESRREDSENIYAFASELNLDKSGNGEKLILNPNIIVPSKNIVTDNILVDVPWKYKNGINFTKSTEVTTKLIDIFGYNPNTIRQYSDMNEALVFVSDSGTVKAHPNGIIEYKALTRADGINLATIVKGKSGNVYSITSGLIEVVRKIYGICDDNTENREYSIRFTSIPQKATIADDMKFELDYFVDGRRVCLPEGSAVEAIVSGGMLTELKMQVRTIKKTEGKTEMKPLFEAIDEFCSQNPASIRIVSAKQLYKVLENSEELGAEWEIKGI